MKNKLLFENWRKFLNEEEQQDQIAQALEAGEESPIEIPEKVIQKTGKSAAELADELEAAKQKLLNLTGISEDKAYSKLKNLLYTPLENLTSAETREVVGTAGLALGLASPIIATALGVATLNPITATVGGVLALIIGAAGSDIERRAEIEQGKDVEGEKQPWHGDLPAPRIRYTPDEIAQMKATGKLDTPATTSPSTTSSDPTYVQVKKDWSQLTSAEKARTIRHNGKIYIRQKTRFER